MKRPFKNCYGWCGLALLLCSSIVSAVPNTNSVDGSIVIIPTFSNGEDKLRMFWARPGETNFHALSPGAVYSGSGTHTVRDPVLWRTNGSYFIACTADGFRQNNGGFDILQSSNLLDWTLVKTVPINAGQLITWSPIRVIDKNGVEWFMCSVRTNPASGTTQRIYITRPTGTNYSDTWQAATRVTFTPDFTNNQIAEACVYNAGQYWLLVKDDTRDHKVNDWFVSSSLTSGYAPGPSGSTNLFRYYEGGGLIPLGNNNWEQIWDDYGPGGLKVSFSSGGFTNWTALVPIGNTKYPLRLSNPAGPFVEPAAAVQQALDGRAKLNPSPSLDPD